MVRSLFATLAFCVSAPLPAGGLPLLLEFDVTPVSMCPGCFSLHGLPAPFRTGFEFDPADDLDGRVNWYRIAPGNWEFSFPLGDQFFSDSHSTSFLTFSFHPGTTTPFGDTIGFSAPAAPGGGPADNDGLNVRSDNLIVGFDDTYNFHGVPNRFVAEMSNFTLTLGVAVPEPATGALVLFGTVILATRRRRWATIAKGSPPEPRRGRCGSGSSPPGSPEPQRWPLG